MDGIRRIGTRGIEEGRGLVSYLDELTALLRDRGVSEERVRATVDDLSSFLMEGGLDPEEEFGPVTDFADDLLGKTGSESEAAPETLVWGADAFEAHARMNEMGAQGWELERLDGMGRFVGHRGETPQVWEYRQVIAPGRRERERAAERLEPEGWELFGYFFTYAYFKRPTAASVGPAAELGERPEPTARSFFWSARGLVSVGVALVVVLISLFFLGTTLWEGDGSDRVATLLGAVVGAAIGLGAVMAVFRLVAMFRNR